MVSKEQFEVEGKPAHDLLDLEMLSEIYRIFSEINRLKNDMADLTTLKIRYAAVVNGLCENTIENSMNGEWLSRKALELGCLIQTSVIAHKKIRELEAELAERYGFLHEYQKTG